MILPFRILKQSLHDFFKDNGIIYSAALSYFVIVAMVPICLFMLSIFGMALGKSDEFYAFLLGRLMDMFPAITADITNELTKLISFHEIATSSLLLYALLSYQLYACMFRVMETMFKTHAKRSVAEMVLQPLLLITLVMLLLFISFAMSSSVPLYNLLQTFKSLADYIPKGDIGTMFSVLLTYILPLLIVTFTVVILYMVLPKRRIFLDDAIWGGLFTAIMIEGAKHFYTWYVTSVVQLGTIYGSLSAFITFLIWVFFCCAIFVLGAEIVHTLDNRRRRLKHEKKMRRIHEKKEAVVQ